MLYNSLTYWAYSLIKWNVVDTVLGWQLCKQRCQSAKCFLTKRRAAKNWWLSSECETKYKIYNWKKIIVAQTGNRSHIGAKPLGPKRHSPERKLIYFHNKLPQIHFVPKLSLGASVASYQSQVLYNFLCPYFMNVYIKLECLYLARLTSLVCSFRVRPEPTWVEHSRVTPGLTWKTIY
jgi:hypothetical protein